MKPFLFTISLLLLPLTLIAQTTPAPKPLPIAAPPPAAPGTLAYVLDQLIGKPQILGLTATGGARALGRVLSGVDGDYTIQTFHFAGPPKYGTKTTGTGTKRRTVRTTEQTTIPDDEAVRLLLSGVAGSDVNPRELPAAQVTLSTSQIKFIQALTPPSKKAASKAKLAPWTLTTLWPIPVSAAK